MGVCCIVFYIDGIFQVFFVFHAILISRFMLFSTLFFFLKVPLHLLVKWEVVSPNSREGQLESIYIISSIPLF